MGCKTIEIPASKLDMKKLLKKAGQGKDLKFDYSEITLSNDGMKAFHELFSKNNEKVNKAIRDLNEIIGSRFDVKQHLALLFNNEDASYDLRTIFEGKDEQETKDNVIAITAILDAMDSEEPTANKYGISEEAIALKNSNDENIEWTSLDKAAALVGKSVFDSNMIFLKGGMLRNSMTYKTEGMKIIKRLEKEGKLQINENGSFIAGSAKSIYSKKLPNTRGLVEGATISINPKIITNQKVIFQLGKQAQRLILPYTELSPTKEARNEIILTHEKLGLGVKEVILALGKGEHAINPYFEDMFDELHNIYVKSGSNEESFVKALKKEFPGDSEKIFLEDSLGVNFNRSNLFLESNQGIEQSKISPLIGFMENYDDINQKKMFFNYFQAKNVRLFQAETILNDQSSKVARALKIASEPVEYSDEDAKNFINRLVVDSGLHEDIVNGKAFEEGYTGNARPSQALRDVVQSLKYIKSIKDKNNNIKNDNDKEKVEKHTMINIMKIISSGELDNDFGKNLISQNAYEKAGYLSAMIDTHEDNNNFSSKHMSESDATASGPMLKLLQNLHVPAVAEIVARLGVEGENIDEDELFNDIYEIVSKRIDKIDKTESKAAVNNKNKKAKMKLLNNFNKLMGFGSMRDLVKMPIMKYFYGQTDTNNKKAIGNEHAQEIMIAGPDKINEALEVLGIELDPVDYSIYNDKEMERKYYNEISRKISKEIGSFLVDEVSDAFGKNVLDENKAELSDIFKAISTLPYAKSKKGYDSDNGIHVMIMDPVHKINWEEAHPNEEFVYAEHRKHRKSLDKLFETLVPNQDLGDVFVTLNHKNENSIQVVPIHMLDAAIIIRSTKILYDQLKEQYKKDHPNSEEFKDEELEKIVNSTPVRLVHDAITVPSKYAGMVGKIYEQQIMHVTRNYNITQMALNEYFYKYNLAKENGEEVDAKLHEKMLELKKKNDEDVKTINEWIDSRLKDNGEYSVIKNSFDTDISEEAVKDKNIKSENRTSDNTKDDKAGSEDVNSKNKNKTSAEKEHEEAKEVASVINSGDYIVFDTETTGKDEENNTVHEIAYNLNGKTKIIHLQINDDTQLTDDFIKFYAENNDVDETETAVRKDINDKANTEEEIDAFMKQMKKDFEGKKVIGHNIPFDIASMKNNKMLNDVNFNGYDTLKLAQYLNGNKKGRNTQEQLTKNYGLDKKGAHTAEGDIKTLAKIAKKLSQDFQDKEVKDKQGSNETLLFSGKDTNGAYTAGSDVSETIDKIDYNNLDKEHKDMYDKVQKFMEDNKDVEFVIGNDSRYTSNKNGEKIEVAADDAETFLEDFSHEIDHANTYGYIVENKRSKPIRYMKRAISEIIKMGENAPLELAEGSNRLKYIGKVLQEKGEEAAVAELVAIMNSEPAASKQIEQIIGNKKVMKNMLQKLVEAVKRFITGKGFNWNDMKEINADDIIKSVKEVVQKGEADRKNNGANEGSKELGSGRSGRTKEHNDATTKQSETKISHQEYTIPERDNEINDVFSEKISNANEWLSEKIEQGVFNSSPWFKELLGKGDKVIRENIPFYEDFANIVDDKWNSTAVKGIRNYFSPNSKMYMRMNELRTLFTTSRQNMIKEMNSESKKIEKELNKVYKTPAEVRHIDDIFAKAALFNVIDNGMLEDLINGTSLKDLIDSASKNLTDKQIDVAEKLSKLYMHQDIVGNNIHNNAKSYGYSNKISEQVEALATLKSLDSIKGSVKTLRNMRAKHKVLFTQLTSLSKATKKMNDKIHSTIHPNGKKDIDIGRGNLIDDINENNYQMISITQKEANSKKFMDDGWKIIREPASNALGIAIKENNGAIQEGVGLNTSYIKTGVVVSKNKLEKNGGYDNGVMETVYSPTNSVYKLVLTADEMDKIGGYLHNPVKSMIRSYAHKKLILDTQEIRNVVSDNMTKTYNDEKSFEDDVKKLLKEDEHPVFVRLPDDVMYKNLSKELRREYTIADNDVLTDIGGFKKGNILVRKDLASEFVGYKELDPFKGSNTASKIFKVTKNIIRYSKINQILLNPGKIMMDLVAGISLVAAKGSSIPEIMKYGREAPKLMREMTLLRNKKLQIEFDINVNGESNKRLEQLKDINKKIKEHRFSPALAHGFIQSMGTELLAKDPDAVQGLEVDMLKLVKKLTHNNKGELTKFNNLVHKFANLGGTSFGIDTLYAALADRIGKIEEGESVANILNDMSEEMASLKSEKDMTKYLGELIATPGSQMVRLGEAMTMYADLIPRWILYNHNLNKGMSDEEAAKDALLSLLDYKVQMPPELKFLSDLYFIPFPSFGLRIQKVLIAMAMKQPVSLAEQLGVNLLLGAHGENMVSSNIVSKWDNGTIITNPNDIIHNGANLIPYNNMLNLF